MVDRAAACRDASGNWLFDPVAGSDRALSVSEQHMNRFSRDYPPVIPPSQAFETIARGAQFRDLIAICVKASPEAIFRAAREVTSSEMKLAHRRTVARLIFAARTPSWAACAQAVVHGALSVS